MMMMMMTKGKKKFSFSYAGTNGNRIVFLPIFLFDSIQLGDAWL